ncbi:MAG TPA: SH3 domain-containing protein [Zoogloea sp.]|uniref:SH3 domain-containing protein n=1 Tax=Zoogloea sp. TaxID=49181 RepID=UPI002C8C97FB|nr:SH3 domain-containing protein [Zoogloea sp.]HMW50818.1 SH3 domain-containing protein [Rhodocyclaceae bacterium]HNB63747.1 SH3 domain-containing protein [Rhodocyclaceae bacterium]HND23406.1 SH3 domain-containing protein [Rhodocyclaceae bacterium]HNI46626.1 SH3 domain-containing protein [Zoogloea sp.]
MTRFHPPRFPAFHRAFATALLLATGIVHAVGATVIHDDALRAQPRSDAAIVMPLHRLSSVDIADARRDWYLVDAAGNRRGWVPAASLRLDEPPASPSAPAAPTAFAASGARPRLQPHASRHALLLDLTDHDPVPPGSHATDLTARQLARALGVPDANIQQPDPVSLTPDRIRRALADLDAHAGPGDRVFVHILARTEPPRAARAPSAAALATPDGRVQVAELGRYLDTLARKAGQVLIVVDAAPPAPQTMAPDRRTDVPSRSHGLLQHWQEALPNSPPNLALLASDSPDFGAASAALLACLSGDAPVTSTSGLARIDDLRRCAEAQLGPARPGARRLERVGNADLVPLPTLTPAAAPGFTPAALLRILHAQRAADRPLDVRRQDDRLLIRSPRAGFLYVLHAPSDGRGFELLLPDASDSRLHLAPGVQISPSLAGTPDGPLLVLVTDAPRRFVRAGFQAAGAILATPIDARSLRDLPAEVLEGDNDPRCLLAETRNLGPEQALRCSAAYASALIEPRQP